MGELRRVIFIGLCISCISILIFNACDSQRTVAIEDSLEFIRSIEPIEQAQNVTIDLRDGHADGAYFMVDLSNIESNPLIGNGTKEAWCIEWDKPSVKGNQSGVKLHSTKGQELWSDVNYFLSNKDALKAEYPDMGWKESQIILWALVKHKDFNIDAIPSYQNFSNHFYKDGKYLFNVELSKKIITEVKAADPGADIDTYAIILENDGQTVIIDGEDVPVGSAEVGPEGGKIASQDERVILDIPAGALSQNTLITISQIELPDEGYISDADGEFISEIYDLSPSGLVFDNPITIKIAYGSDIEKEQFLEIVHSDDEFNNSFVVEEKDIDYDNNEIIFNTYSFSNFFIWQRPFLLTYPFRWNADIIKYYIEDDQFGYLWNTEEDKRQIANAIESYNNILKSVQFSRTFDDSEANLVLKTVDSCFGCKGRFNWPAYAPWIFTENSQVSIDFLSSYNMSVGYINDIQERLNILVKHEIGHALGLAHNPNEQSIRSPNYTPIMWIAGRSDDVAKEFDRAISGDEKAALDIKYELRSEDWPRDTETEVVDVYNPITGRTWMDRNLGASRVATSLNDEQALGDLYQWGRAADGHQKRNSRTTTTVSTTNQPENGNFIIPGNPNDWRTPSNDNLWQGVDGINNPCPEGYRLPTKAEWRAEERSWSGHSSNQFKSLLKLPFTGVRLPGSGVIGFHLKNYWSSTPVSGTDLAENYRNDTVSPAIRAVGFSVRCIKD